jgi:phosphate transport system substrate-binding protein
MTQWSRPIILAVSLLTWSVSNHSLWSQNPPKTAPQDAGQKAPAKPTQAGQNPTQQASVSELIAMLQAVDPYRATQEIKGTVTVSGSTSMDAMAHIWRSGFNEFYQGAKVEISANGSKEAFDKLVEKPTGVAMLSHPVTNEDLAELKTKGLKDPVAFVVAREALAVFVHSSNPIRAINSEQMKKIFTQGKEEKVTWGMVGAGGEWADKPITIISRTEDSGTQVYLRDFVFVGAKLKVPKASYVSNAEALTAVSSDPTAIAICGMKTPGSMIRPLNLMAGTASIPSDDRAVMTSQYPLTRPMTLVVDMGQSGADAKAAQEFVHYALCQSGQAAAISATYYPVDLPLLRASLHKLQGSQVR